MKKTHKKTQHFRLTWPPPIYERVIFSVFCILKKTQKRYMLYRKNNLRINVLVKSSDSYPLYQTIHGIFTQSSLIFTML